MMGPLRFTMWFSWVSDSMITPCLQMILAMISNCVGGVGQAAAAEIQLLLGVHLREGEDQDQAVAVVRHGDLVSGLHIRRARGVAADPRGQAHAGVQLRPMQSAEGRVLPIEVGAAVGAQEGICDPDLKDAKPHRALQVHRLAYVKLEVFVARAARFRLSIQIVVIAFFLLPNHRPARPGTLAAEYAESAEICCAQGCGCCHCCCIQGGLDGS